MNEWLKMIGATALLNIAIYCAIDERFWLSLAIALLTLYILGDTP